MSQSNQERHQCLITPQFLLMYFLLDGEHTEQRVTYRVCSEVCERESWLNTASAIGGALCTIQNAETTIRDT